MRTKEQTVELLARVEAGLSRSPLRSKLLESIVWSAEVEEKFFAAGARELPQVSYAVDAGKIQKRIAELAELEKSIDGDDRVAEWLRATVRSYVDGNRMLLAVGTAEFYRISKDVYGGARTRFLGDSLRNVDLADHLLERLTVRGWDEARDPDPPVLDAGAFVAALNERRSMQSPPLTIDVTVDTACAAKVQAGRTRIRVRAGATFTAWEVDGLWVHEVETHALTAQNGAAQPRASFLQGGGPRTTRTQEGLAIFAELYTGNLTVPRMERLARRVKLVDMAEQGADFLELHRYLVGQGVDPRDAFYDAQRVCRGGRVEGGAPFTKDAAYLAGLLEVYTFLSALVRGGLRDEAEVLVAGRIALEDVPALVELRHKGILERPVFRPAWLENWRALLPYFAFASFVTDVNVRAVEERYASVLELAAKQRAPKG